MSQQIPVPTLSVEPGALAHAAQPLTQLAAALESALPGLAAVWHTAAHTLAARSTGQVLGMTQPAVMTGLTSVTLSIDQYGQTLARAAAAYRTVESQAVRAGG